MVSRSHVRGVSTSCEANESFWRSIGIPEAARRSVGERQRGQMVRVSAKLLKEAGSGLNKTLSQILVCPVSKQPLRFCEETNSLISDAIGVSFPIKDGIPCLVPQDGKILDIEGTNNAAESPGKKE
ncbi:uncharacterized protein LOC107424463 isoform X1 [Ziziphus jujuba]|uniref:Protein preY, mitochondrial n=1 Tax=Ziziphus jujuba TaxID=326968 RepID=A0A6P4A3P8_ZIZJJ|nr:uncharacterized protein LOC107424463 isoform X1 [Ziziphus jujuba]XP_015889762.4 uncharacterized protein LOC107424463 isoform X1 [Ziziphus jujuba]XP_015889763.4 uncharacterized protein LOC107424463 isoform X1 [Ziziphus jujuba]XP_048335370.2 uncharacterized protein LOC107424463 isoform X1 [Ziziphus jujuba]